MKAKLLHTVSATILPLAFAVAAFIDGYYYISGVYSGIAIYATYIMGRQCNV